MVSYMKLSITECNCCIFKRNCINTKLGTEGTDRFFSQFSLRKVEVLELKETFGVLSDQQMLFLQPAKKGIIWSKTHKKKQLCNPHICVFLFMFDTYM